MNHQPRIVVFQCQFCLYAETDQHWMDHELPENFKLVKVPCSGRISPLFVLNAFQGGADGVLISGCVPEMCHYKEGNLGARRQLDEFSRLLNYIGLEEQRIRFAWIDVNQRGRIQQELASFEKDLANLPRNERLATRTPVEQGVQQ